jgi:hypothetical protein
VILDEMKAGGHGEIGDCVLTSRRKCDTIKENHPEKGDISI